MRGRQSQANKLLRAEKHYEGRPDGRVWIREGATRRPLPLRTDLCWHGSDFAWGYGGSGPAQLALALLSDALDDDQRALDLHQRLKLDVVSRLPEEETWTLSAGQLRAWASLQSALLHAL